MTILNAWCGATTPGGATVVSKLTGTTARLAVATDAALTDPTFSDPTSPDSEGVVRLVASGLDPDTRYHWAIAEHAAEFPGATNGYVTTPDHASLDITGAISVRVEATIADWTSPAQDGIAASLCAKWSDGNQESFLLRINNDGALHWFSTADGSTNTIDEESDVVTLPPGRGAVRVDVDPDNGGGDYEVTFYTGPTIFGPWTQLGSTATGTATSIHSGTAELSIGGHNNGTVRLFGETIHRVEVHDLDAGTVVANPDFARTEDTSNFDDEAGRTWTFNGAVTVTELLDTVFPGQFRTHPPLGQPADFTVIASGDAGSTPDFPGVGDVLASGRISNAEVFDTIRQRAVDNEFPLFIHLGDDPYYDLGSDFHGITGGASVANYRRQFDDVLLQPRQHDLFRNVATTYVWDDHDYGPNDSDRTHVGRAAAQQVYREKVPHYPLPDPEGVYQSWQIGRVLFLMSDLRSFRDPNTTPHSASKTMMGEAQKTWMSGLLASTSARFLVWINPERAWHTPEVASGSSADHWGNFPDERDEITAMLTSLGWTDRMVCINADHHNLGMDSGASNDYGGFPVYQWAPMDATPSTGDASLWDLGLSGDTREQYGTLRLRDTGTHIEVIATGWEDQTALFQHSWSVQVDDEPPPEPTDPGGLPQVAQARITTRLTWLSCNLSDGAVITELPDLQGDEVSRVIGEYTSANLSLPIPAVGGHDPDITLAQRAALAIQSTQPPRTKIVAVVNDVPAWEGIPLPRDLGTDAKIPLGCVSMEGYLRHVYITDHTFNEQDVALIADGILRDAVTTPHGPGVALVIDAPNIGTIASRSYLDIDNQTVYAGLQELMKAGLLEWTLSPDWRMGMAYRVVDTIARVRAQLGKSEPTAVFQSATFSSQGASDARYQLQEDYGDDRYANVVRLHGAGEGDDQLRSAPAIDQAQLDSGVPVWELRDSAPQNVEQQALLDLHAERRLDRVRDGAHTLEITARWDAPGARLGVDWDLGDLVRHELVGHAHPNGFNGVRRAIGFALSIQRGTIRPILQEELE